MLPTIVATFRLDYGPWVRPPPVLPTRVSVRNETRVHAEAHEQGTGGGADHSPRHALGTWWDA